MGKAYPQHIAVNKKILQKVTQTLMGRELTGFIIALISLIFQLMRKHHGS
jgi:hypothetical protein